MFNVRISVIAAFLAFILSLMIGLINQSSMPALILRPVFFGILFFGLPFFFTLLINRFLPELLENNEPAPDLTLPGSRINITEPAPAIPGGIYARPDDTEEGIGNIGEAVNTSASDPDSLPVLPDNQGLSGLDQNGGNGYTEQKQAAAPESEGGFDVLPDLESLAGAFLPSSGNKEEETYDYQDPDVPKRSVTGNKPQKMDVDFNPKDLAAGIRTILKKQEG